jgi:hypothetical protein
MPIELHIQWFCQALVSPLEKIHGNPDLGRSGEVREQVLQVKRPSSAALGKA